MARKLAAVVFSLGCVQAGPLMALGLGEISLESYLNEPLRAEVDLLNVQGLHEDQIRIRLATAEDFKRMGVDRAYFLTSISFNVEIDDSGRARIVLTSEDPVLEQRLVRRGSPTAAQGRLRRCAAAAATAAREPYRIRRNLDHEHRPGPRLCLGPLELSIRRHD